MILFLNTLHSSDRIDSMDSQIFHLWIRTQTSIKDQSQTAIKSRHVWEKQLLNVFSHTILTQSYDVYTFLSLSYFVISKFSMLCQFDEHNNLCKWFSWQCIFFSFLFLFFLFSLNQFDSDEHLTTVLWLNEDFADSSA